MQTLDGVKIQVKADIGFMNEKPADKFVEKPVYVCMLAETSDGRKAHFERVRSVTQARSASLLLTCEAAPSSAQVRAWPFQYS